jgi:hypothetical protein
MTLSLRTSFLPLVAAFAASELTAQTWLQLQPAPYPSLLLRRAGGIAYHPANGLVMYGGLQSGPTLTLNDTWTFDGTNWNAVTPATQPPPRWGHRMVYDSRRAVIVTFGGRSPTTTATSNDTWEWNGADWQQVFPTASPNPRAFYSMAYDERRGRTVLYGTQSGSTIGTSGGNQTWEYDGTTWSQVTTAFTPPGLETPAMAYDKGRAVTVMFGGWNGLSPGVMYNATWEFDGTNWVTVATATAPSARYRAGCVYDDRRGRVVVYGGFGSGTALQDTWEYDGNDWTQVLTGGPTKSTEAYVGYLPFNNATVHFGGSGPGGTNNESWLYFGSSTAIAAKFGKGCNSGSGVPDLAPTTVPLLGSNYTLSLTAGNFSGVGFIAHGFSNQLALLGSLPLDLTPFGFAGCQLEVSPDALSLLVLVGGSASQSLAMPNTPALADLKFFSQCVVLDPSAPNGNGGLSNAVHGVLGN